MIRLQLEKLLTYDQHTHQYIEHVRSGNLKVICAETRKRTIRALSAARRTEHSTCRILCTILGK